VACRIKQQLVFVLFLVVVLTSCVLALFESFVSCLECNIVVVVVVLVVVILN